MYLPITNSSGKDGLQFAYNQHVAYAAYIMVFLNYMDGHLLTGAEKHMHKDYDTFIAVY